jgi:phosphoribosylformylglycinamidine synthase I
MTKPNVAVLYAPGTSCHEETCYALECANARGTVVLLSDLLQGRSDLDLFDALVIPGGSSWGDHPGGGRVFAIHLVSCLKDIISRFLDQSKPVLGIQNGCQVLLEAGILPELKIGTRTAAIVQNQSAQFESRWVDVIVGETNSLWTKGLTGVSLRMPVAYYYGRFVFDAAARFRPAFMYVDNNRKVTPEYPSNPAGSPEGIAGIVDQTGLVMGTMLHPERAILDSHGSTDGLRIFENMVQYCQSS